MSCPICGFNENNSAPYRTSANQMSEENKEKKFKQQFGRYLSKFLAFRFVSIITNILIGTLTTAVVLWVVFPGAYKLGMYIGNDVFGWDVRDIHHTPAGWFIGILAMLSLLVGYPIGKTVKQMIGNNNE